MLTYVTAWENLNSMNASPPEVGQDGDVPGDHCLPEASPSLSAQILLPCSTSQSPVGTPALVPSSQIGAFQAQMALSGSEGDGDGASGEN